MDLKKKDVVISEPEDGTVSSGSLEVIRNHVYFYSDVTKSSILKLKKNLITLNYDLASKKRELDIQESPKIHLHINSYGGSVFAGLAAVDDILRSQIPVTTTVEGCAASAATLMSVVGKERTIDRHACMLIHELSSSMWGKYSQFQDEMKNLDKLMQMIQDIYKEHTKISSKQLKEILKHDIYWDAKTCLKYGLVDYIL